MTSTYKATKLPQLDCEPILSILRIPTPEYNMLDTTNLVDLYGFSSDDITFDWRYKLQSPGAPDRDPSPTDPCDVAELVNSNKYKYIVWQPKDAWTVPVHAWSCCEGGGSSENSDMLLTPAPVAYATNRPSYLPTPVFNPNQAAGGVGSIEGLPPTLGQVVSVDYAKNEATVKLFGIDAGGNLILTSEEVKAIII